MITASAVGRDGSRPCLAKAEVWSNVLRFFADADGHVLQRRGARARIRALRTGDGWRFTRVQVETVWAEG